MSSKKRILDSNAFGDSGEKPTSGDVLGFLLGEDEAEELIAKKPAQVKEGELWLGDFRLSLMGLEFKGNTLAFEDWRDIGIYLSKHKDAIQWMIGDWANLAEPYLDQWVPDTEETDTPEGKYSWLAQQTGYSYAYLRTLASVAGRFPVYLRSYTEGYATFSHCRIIADKGLSEEQSKVILEQINQNLWSVSQLKKELGMALPDSKQPAIVKRTAQYRTTWRKGWSKADYETRLEVLEDMRRIVAEMEETLEDE